VHNWEKYSSKVSIFPLQNIRTAIVFVANTHARVSQTRTAHAQAEKWIFPVGFLRFPQLKQQNKITE
jgi:hypothetical protein